MGSIDRVDDWKDQQGRRSLSADANTIKQRKAEEVIRVLRNALAHGNIIYLDKDSREIAGNRMAFMAFLSRYEETEEQRDFLGRLGCQAYQGYLFGSPGTAEDFRGQTTESYRR